MRLICSIDVTAFASVMVVLFVFVWAPTWGPSHHWGPDLPKVSHPVSMWGANREDALVVMVMRTGDVFFGNEKLPTEQLPDKIRERIRQGAERKVYIEVDERARYGHVAEVLDSVRAVGIEKIGFLVYQRKPSTPDQ